MVRQVFRDFNKVSYFTVEGEVLNLVKHVIKDKEEVLFPLKLIMSTDPIGPVLIIKKESALTRQSWPGSAEAFRATVDGYQKLVQLSFC